MIFPEHFRPNIPGHRIQASFAQSTHRTRNQQTRFASSSASSNIGYGVSKQYDLKGERHLFLIDSNDLRKRLSKSKIILPFRSYERMPIRKNKTSFCIVIFPQKLNMTSHCAEVNTPF